jgi:hypothetical protein
MDVVTQIVFITYGVLMIAGVYALVGKEQEADNLRSGFALLAFLNSVFTIAFLIWWDPTTVAETVARWTVIGLMWVPFLIDLPKINRKPKTATIVGALSSTVLMAARIGLVLAFWVL